MPPLTVEPFGETPDGVPVERYTLANRNGMRVRILTYGGIVQSIGVPDRDGRVADVVLGFPELAGYLGEHPYFGAIIGRYANRIGGAAFRIGDDVYELTANSGPNTLHGGARGFDKRVWTAEPAVPVTAGIEADTPAGEIAGMTAGVTASVRLSYVSPDGEEGFPGTLRATVGYTLTDRDELRIDYRAVTDGTTVVNLTNHSYFNLAGEASGDVYGHRLRVMARHYLPTDADQIPTGERAAVDDTPFDFTRPRPLGERLGWRHPQLAIAGGYDHTLVLDHGRGGHRADADGTREGGTSGDGAPGGAGRGDGRQGDARRGDGGHGPADHGDAGRVDGVRAPSAVEPVAEVEEPGSGRRMRVYTTEPGIQLYTANHLDGRLVGIGGRPYRRGAGFCLETQHFPDSPNKPEFPSTLLRPGEVYQSTTVYAFSW